jgi:hypothetical protein
LVYPSKKVEHMDIIEDLKEFIENETRSCSMDFGGITPLYVYRMWNGSVALEDIEAAMAEIKFSGR